MARSLVRHAWGWANAERRIAVHAAHAVPHVLDHQAVHLRPGAGRLPRSVGAGCRRARAPAAAGAAGAGRAAPVSQPVRPARLLGGGDAARLAGRGAVRRQRGRPRHRRHPDAALRARHALFLRQPEFPHPVGHHAGAHRPRLRRTAAHPHLRPRRHGDRAARPPTPAPCRTAPRATRARRRRLSRRGEPHPVDRRCRARRQPRRHDRLGAPHRRHARRRGRALQPPVGPGQLRRRHPGRLRLRPRPSAPSWAARSPATAARCAAGAAIGCTCRRSASPSSSCSTTCRMRTTAAVDLLAAVLGEDRPPPAAQPPPPGLARRLYRAGDRACRCASMRADGQVRLRYGHFPERARPAGRRHGAQRRRRAASARRRRPVDGPPAREPKLAPPPMRRHAAPWTSPAAIAARNSTPN